MEKLQDSLNKKKLDLTGGESVYCINQSQMHVARRLVEEDAEAHPKMKELFDAAISELTRNEQAALSFVLIDHLNNTPRN